MLRLFVKDNTNGAVHEYGTDRHDALVLQEDGSLHYYNLQNGCGTMFPAEGYSFCLADGTSPTAGEATYECEPYVDIGGECCRELEPATHADRIRSMGNESLAWLLMDFRIDAFRKSYSDEHTLPDTQKKICEWLQQPAEEDI